MPKNQKKLIPFYVVIVAGLALGLLRGANLAWYFNRVTGLYEHAVPTYVLPALTALTAVYIAAVAFRRRGGSKTAYVEMYKANTAEATVLVAAGLIMCAAGFIYCLRFFSEPKLSRIMLGILTILCGVEMIALTRARKNRSMSELVNLGGVVPIFWVCFMLILTFLEHPVEPILAVFSYDLLAACAMLLSIYACAACIYDKYIERTAFFASLAAMLLLLISGLGRLVAAIMSADMEYITEVDFRLATYFSMFLWCGVSAWQLSGRMESQRLKGLKK